jgi:hypothetical protein
MLPTDVRECINKVTAAYGGTGERNHLDCFQIIDHGSARTLSRDERGHY